MSLYRASHVQYSTYLLSLLPPSCLQTHVAQALAALLDHCTLLSFTIRGMTKVPPLCFRDAMWRE